MNAAVGGAIHFLQVMVLLFILSPELKNGLADPAGSSTTDSLPKMTRRVFEEGLLRPPLKNQIRLRKVQTG
jgi:hypothetical protein